MRPPQIVGVQKSNKLPTRMPKAVVARYAALRILLPEVAETFSPLRLMPLNDFECFVRRAVVHNNHLNLRPNLSERRLDCDRQVVYAVISGDDDASKCRQHIFSIVLNGSTCRLCQGYFSKLSFSCEHPILDSHFSKSSFLAIVRY